MIRCLAKLVRAVGVVSLVVAFGLSSLPGAAATPVPPLTSPVVDTTGTLAPADIARLEAQALSLQRRSGSQLQILMLPSTAPESIDDYAQRVFDTWKLGRKGIDDGLLIVVARDDRKARIHTGTGLEKVVDDATAARLIQEYLAPKFRRGDYAGGLDDATLVLASLMNGEPLPAATPAPATSAAPGEEGTGVGAGVLILLVLGTMAVAVWLLVLLFRYMVSPAFASLATAAGSGSAADPTSDRSTCRHQGNGWLSGASRSSGGFGGWSGGGGGSRGGGASGGW